MLKLRATLAILVLLILAAMAVAVVILADKINPLAAGILGTIIGAFIKDNTSSFGFIFDGVPTDDSNAIHAPPPVPQPPKDAP